MSADLSRLGADDLRALAAAAQQARCGVCAPLVCAGWDSLPATFDASALQRVGTLQSDPWEDATLLEHHPRGTHAWSVDAPIAPAFYPYNRCDVLACKACARPFLRYTEYGGYYQDERIRRVNAALVDDTRL